MLIPALKKAANRYHEKADAEQKEAQRKIYGASAGGQWAICKELRSRMAAPLTAVERPEKGTLNQPRETVATSPKDVDKIIRKTYGKIYKGNASDLEGKTVA